MTDSDLKEKEDADVLDDTAADFSPEEQARFGELAKNDDQVGGGFTDEGEGGGRRIFRGRFKRKQLVGGGVAGIIIAIIFGGFSILQGPLQIVHFAQLLERFHFSHNENFMDGRSSRFIRYLRKGEIANGRLGYISGKFADRWQGRMEEKLGLRAVYTRGTQRFAGYEIVDPKKAESVLKDMDKEGIGQSSGLDVVDINNKPVATTSNFVDLRDVKFSKRRSTVRTVMKGTDLGKVTSTVASRLEIIRGGIDFHPLTNVKRQSGDKFFDYINTRRKERAEARKQGSVDKNAQAPKVDQDPNGDGKPDPDPLAREAAQDAQQALDEIADVNVGVGTDWQTKLAAIRESTAAKLAGGGAAAIGIICTVRGVGEGVQALQYQNIILPMMRMGMEVMTTGNQVMTGKDVNTDELGVVTRDLYDEVNKSSWASAKSIQAELGEPQTGPDLPASARPSKANEKPLVFQIIDTIPFVDQACGLSDIIGGLPIIKQVGELSGTAIDAALSPFGVSIEQFADSIVNFLAGEAVNTFAEGAELGNIANYGARLGANDQAIAMGGRELTTTETAALDARSTSERALENSQKSLFARLFDLHDVDSVASTVMLDMPKSLGSMFSSLISTPTRIFSWHGAKASAAGNYDYGFNEFGFSLPEEQDEQFEDPFANADVVEPRLAALNQKYGDCFSMTVDPVTFKIRSGPAKQYKDIPKDCHTDANGDGIEDNTELLRYRVYLADKITELSLTCYEGEDGSCQQLGFGNTTQQTTTTVTPTDARGQDTSAQTCKLGQDAGIGITPDPNIKIRLCTVNGITVNVAIETNVDALVKGGQAAGLSYTGSGYRSYDEQVGLRRKNCGTSQYDIYQKPSGQCSPPTAIPGTSLHEWGLAVDFKCGGVTITDRTSRCYTWIEENQGLHQLKNLPSEAWHWSSTGN